MATTPKYAFPYPIGTDRIMDGDNVMQALAERVEAVLGGGSGNTRYWSAIRGADDQFPAGGAWTAMLVVTLTGLPIGGVAIVTSDLSIQAPAGGGAYMQNRLSSGGGTLSPANAYARSSIPAANYWTSASVTALVVATAANPTVTQEALVTGGGNATVLMGSHLTAYRIV